MIWIFRIIVASAVLVAAGCATTTGTSNANVPEAHPRIIEARVEKAGWEHRDARRGGSLYALKCGRCHKFYDPAAYEDSEWQTWFRKMSKKAKLEPAQEKLLSEYLGTARNPR